TQLSPSHAKNASRRNSSSSETDTEAEMSEMSDGPDGEGGEKERDLVLGEQEEGRRLGIREDREGQYVVGRRRVRVG
ncbi:hypothetical protein HK097_005871, partial [Rhizophlyctis rosea]